MKKIVLVFILFISIIINSGCGALKSTTNGGEKEGSKVKAKEKEPITIICDEMVVPVVTDIVKDYNLNNPEKITFKILRKQEAFTEMKEGKKIITFGYDSDVDKEDKNIKSKEVAKDGVAIVVSKDNPMDSISLTQLRDVYTGKIKSWRGLIANESEELYGDKVITAVTYNNYDLQLLGIFESSVVNTPIKGYYGDNVVYVSTVGESKGRSRGNYNIGYIPAMHVDNTVKMVKLNGLNYSVESVKSGLYPLTISIKMYYKKDDEKDFKRFFKYLESDDGKKTINKHCLPKS